MTALRQALRFSAVGAANTAVTLAVLASLGVLGVPTRPAGALAFAAGALNGYRLNRGWTFASARRGVAVAARYVAVQALGAGLDALGLGAAVASVHISRIEGEAAVLPWVTLVTFVLSRRWVFAAA